CRGLEAVHGQGRRLASHRIPGRVPGLGRRQLPRTLIVWPERNTDLGELEGGLPERDWHGQFLLGSGIREYVDSRSPRESPALKMPGGCCVHRDAYQPHQPPSVVDLVLQRFFAEQASGEHEMLEVDLPKRWKRRLR